MKIVGILSEVKKSGKERPSYWLDVEGLRIYIPSPVLLETASNLLYREVEAHVLVRFYNTSDGRFFTKVVLQAIRPVE